jgi:hypothetical protein
LLLPYLDPEKANEVRYSRSLTGAGQDGTKSGSKNTQETNTVEATGTPGPIKAEETEQREMEDKYLSELYERILRVLKGHMVWICARAECSRLESFSPHHWPDGRRIFNLAWLPLRSLVDTPLQLLKVLCYSKLRGLLQECLTEEQTEWGERMHPFTEEQREEREWMQSKLRAKARSWIDKIHNINDRGTYAFYDHTVPPRYPWLENDQEPKYRLTDHVIIGLTLKTAIQLELCTKYRVWSYYKYEDMRSKILKRFTVEHPISKQRILVSSGSK